MSSIDQPFIHAVQLYRRAGFLGTIPLPSRKKHPPPTGFTGARAAYPDASQLKKWCNPHHEDYVSEGNIGLRLGDVDLSGWKHMPITYGGHLVTGWEILGIDVDTYKNKNGYAQLLALQKDHGELPATLRSSSRWGAGTTSSISLYFVPRGYRYVGKAAGCIEIIQKRHRYMVVWPSTNPDARNARYEWRDREGGTTEEPTLAMIAVLPEAWWKFLSNNGTPESDDPVSDMIGDDLLDWAAKSWSDPEGEMCAGMERTLSEQINDVEAAHESHPKLNKGHWAILRSGAEGHAGWLTALRMFNKAWIASAGKKRDASDGMREEIQRSVLGALGKIEPNFNMLPDDPCATKAAVAAGDYDEKLDNFATRELCGCGIENCPGCEIGAKVAELDSNGLGPVVGKLSIIKKLPPDSYGMHDEGNGQHFIDLYGDNIKYISSRKNWALWVPQDGASSLTGRWYADTDDRYVSLAYQLVRKRQEVFAKELMCDAIKNLQDASKRQKAKAWLAWAKRSGDITPIKNALASSHRLYVGDNNPVALNGTEFDANPKLLGCANGILELTEDPELREPCREDYVTFNTDVPYIPWRQLGNSDDINLDGYHLWQEYLNLFLPDPEIRHFAQKVMGHMLIGENPEKLLIFLYGNHDTGKSTMIGAIAGALGDYYGTIDMNLFSASRFNPQLIQSSALRITGMSEIDAGVMDAATVKRLTGNDRIVVEQKFSDQKFEARPQFTTVIACNNPPIIKNADQALHERILALPFDAIIDRTERKYERQTQIERYSGIAVLSWLVEGWRLYCIEGIKRESWPTQVRRLHGAIIAEFNNTQQFIVHMLQKAEECDDGIRAENKAIESARKRNRFSPSPADWPIEWTPPTAFVYELYTRWCLSSGEKTPLTQIQFTRESALGKTQNRSIDGKVQKCFVGVRIKP